MKVRSKLNIPKANKIFTDREEPRESFWKKYNQFKADMLAGKNEVSVLAYYGIGGIGKTSLINKLMSEMGNRLEKPLYVSYDFNQSQDRRSVLTSLRNDLVEKYHFKFSSFDKALNLYVQKIGEDYSSLHAKTFSSQIPALDLALSVSGNVPVLDTISKAVTTIDKGIAFARDRFSSAKRELDDFKKESPAELLNRLISQFIQDLSKNLEKRKEPLVIFLDTYEKLVNEMESVGEPLTNDEWLRGEEGLIKYTSNVFWVIAGREKLKWERFDSAWEEALEQHMLGSLSETDGIHFLEAAGVADPKLQKELYDLTIGTPVYLDLCVDSYYTLISKGVSPTIDDFGKNPLSLIERFARYMDRDIKELVCILAQLQMWNDEMVLDVVDKIYNRFSMSLYEGVKDYSFISSISNGFFTIHQTVGEVFSKIPKVFPEVFYKKILTTAADYCKQMISNGISSNDYDFYLQRFVCYSLKITADNCLKSFYEKTLKDIFWELYDYGRFDSIKKILEQLEERINDKASDNYVFILKWYAELALGSGKDSEAKKYTEDYCNRCEQLFGKESDQYADAAHLLASVFQSLAQYSETLKIRKEIFEIRKKTLGENHITTLFAMNNIGISYYLLGQYNKALEISKDVFEKEKTILNENDENLLRIRQAIAIYLNALGRCKEALDLSKINLKKYKDIYGDNHPDTLVAMRDVADILSSLGKYKEALRIDKEILKKRQEILGKGHPDTIEAMKNVASILTDLGKYKEALEIGKQVLTRMQETYGENHPETTWAMNILADIYSGLGQYEKAFEIRTDMLKKRQEILGKGHPDVIDAMMAMSQSLIKAGQYEKAYKLNKQVLSECQERLGDNPAYVLTAMYNIGCSLNWLGRYEEALKINKTVLKKRQQLLGDDHLKTLLALENVAYSLKMLKRYEESLNLFNQLLLKNQKILGEDHRNTIKAMVVVADLLNNLNRYEEALDFYKKALKKRQSLLGENNPATISLKHDIAVTLNRLGKNEEALEWGRKVLAQFQEIYGEDHNSTVIAMNNIVYYLFDLKRYKEAFELEKKVLAKREVLLGENHPDTKASKEMLEIIQKHLS